MEEQIIGANETAGHTTAGEAGASCSSGWISRETINRSSYVKKIPSPEGSQRDHDPHKLPAKPGASCSSRCEGRETIQQSKRKEILSRFSPFRTLIFAPLLLSCSSSSSAGKTGTGRDASTALDSGGPAADQAALSSPGPYVVATRGFTLVDTSRATPSNGTYAGAPTRTLPVAVWYPASSTDAGVSTGGPFPVIAYAHGFLSSNQEAVPLMRHLASHGYIVVAPTFPLSSGGAPGGPTFADLAHQPGDLTFAVESLHSPTGPDPELGSAMDMSHQGIAGLSLGGATVLVAAYHPTLHLPNIQVAVAFAPASCFFGKGIYGHALPTVMLSGSSDELVPYESVVEHAFDFAPPPLTLVKLVGGTHLGFIGVEVADAGNTDQVIGCGAVQGAVNTAGASGIVGNLGSDLAAGASGPVLDFAGCTNEAGAVCSETFRQTMHATRQVELAHAIALAEFEAVIRGKADAARFISSTLGKNNADVQVMVKK